MRFFLKSIKILNIIELLFTAHCEKVSVLHTIHPFWGDTGKYFYFEASDFTKMVDGTDWHEKNYEIIQRGSKSWTGTIKVFDDRENYGVFGRRDPGAAYEDWVQGDQMQLKACVEAGI